jgi:hypothetical protein
MSDHDIRGDTYTMHYDVPCEFPAGYDGSAVLERLAQVLDPELDEPILDLGFVRSPSCVPAMPELLSNCQQAGAR